MDQLLHTPIDTSYKVLARKYRPNSFAGLVGQEALVRTLTNAIRANRVAHAFLLSGIRGIGKTTTARIIAKTLNCTALNISANTIEPCGKCENCLAASQESHPDILEMDAASRTGVGDIREIIESTHYLPVMAKTKIFIIDEVHMLSNNAFNALLKTLEEPPAHVKFIFATTETRKIPITVLSRCQRFDLKRLTEEKLLQHLQNIAAQEQINIEKEALSLIVTKAEGSVRDSLSLLDQARDCAEDPAIPISASYVRNMLGISSKSKLFTLFGYIVNGDTNNAVKYLRTLYDDGSDPLLLVEDLLELSHLLTKLKFAPEIIDSPVFTEIEKERGKEFASQLSIPSLTVIWQMLLKGLQELRVAPIDISAAEMLVIRLCFVSHIPLPIDMLSKSEGKSEIPQSFVPTAMAENKKTVEANHTKINDFKDLVQLFLDKQEIIIHHHLVEDVHLVKFEPRRLEINLGNDAPKDLPNNIMRYLSLWSGEEWKVIVSEQKGSDTLKQIQINQEHEAKIKAASNPLVQAVLDNFSGATVKDVHQLNPNILKPKEL
jgi:DNA polymerase-3 subunit gamma/tau